MITNANFIDALEKSGMSMYALSNCSGIPYTTINEIRNGKNDINQCAAGTVARLAAALEVQADTIMNEINYLDGLKGRYKGIDYVWVNDDSSRIIFEYDGERVTLDTGKQYNIPSRLRYYSVIAGWMIKDHINHKEWEKKVSAMMAERRERQKR